MKKLGYLFLLLLLATPFSIHAAWYDSAWDFRIEISSDNTKVADTETDFPLYLDLSLLGSDFFSNVKSDGSDIIITSGDEVTPLDYELVSLNAVSETGEIHFKADTLSGASDTSFYIYYGNSGTNAFVPANIWDAFRGVWHFEEDLSVDSGTRGVATQAAMDGSDGSWVVWYGDEPISTNVKVAVDEDQVSDTERSHTTEQVGYWVFGAGMETILDKNGTIIGETGVIETTGTSTSHVELSQTYTDPVVVVTSQYISGVPAVVRVDNLISDSFDVFMQNPEPSASAGTPADTSVYYVVIEAGDYLLPGNIALEADTATITGVNYSGSWGSGNMLNISPVQTYTNPVVLGSVLTSNNSQWQSFWSSNGSSGSPATTSSIYVGRHTGAETTPTVVDETLGYIIVEQHSGTNNSFESRAQLTPDSVAGIDNAPPYQYGGLSLGGGGVLSDSTVNSFDAESTGDVDFAVSSQIGKGVDLSGSGSRLPITGLNYTNNNNLNTLTVAMWLNTTDTARSGIFDFDRSEHWELGLNFHNAGGGQGRVSFDTASSSGGIKDLNSSVTINDGNWHHVVAVFDKDDIHDKKIYIDGSLDSSVDQHPFALGRGVTRYGFFGDGSEAGTENGSVNNIPYEGLIDEASIQHAARDAEWISTTFNNQSDNDAFWSVSLPEQDNVAPEAPTGLFFNHTDAQSGLTNPTNVEIGGVSLYTPYFSALYHGDGDTAEKAYIQVSTDPTFTTINYWDSDWFTLPTVINDEERSIDIEYGDLGLVGVTAPLLSLAMDDGDVTYYWRIAFEDDSGLQGAFSSPAVFSLLDISREPENISATKIEGSPDTFIVNWQDVSLLETSFEVEFREDTGGGFGVWQAVTLPTSGATPANTTSWDMDNTVGNAAYNFRVRSCNYSGCSAWVEDALTHYTDPESPVKVCSEYVSDTDFNVTWEKRSVFDNTSIEQCDGLTDCNAATFSIIGSMQPEPGPVSSVGTVTNQIYRWSAYADNGVIISDPTYTNFEYTAPSAPTGVEAVRVSDSIINLTWTDTSLYEDGFRVWASVDGAAFIEVTAGVNTTDADATSYVYTSASAGHSYQFDVRAHISQTVCDAIINSELLSVSALSNIVVTTPDAPLVTTTSYVDDDEVSVSWIDESAHEDGFNIYVRIDDGAWSLAGSVGSDVTSYTYTSGSANHVYDFYVESYVNIALPGNPDALSNTEGPSEFRRIYTAPFAPVLSLDGISSTSVDWGVSDTAAYELGFTLYDNADDSLMQSIPSPDIASVAETGLTPNTSYGRYMRAYVENAGARLESIDSNEITFYTLANSPADISIIETTPGTVDITWTDGGNPSGTEFYIESTSGLSSGWVSDMLSWNETNVNCGSFYEFRLKARNAELTETGEEIIELETAACPNSGVIKYSCKDKEASNYSAFGKHDQDMCVYVSNQSDTSLELGEGERCESSQLLTQNMRRGDRNGIFSVWQGGIIAEVKILQAHMNRLGFTSGVEDGILGIVTDGAIKRMQKFLGTFQDGMVGPITRSLINNSCNNDEIEEDEVIVDVQLEQTPQCYITYTRLITTGMRGEDVKQVQTCMNSLGYTSGPEDGIYGPLTYKGITSYQKDKDLRYIDGVVGPETSQSLNSLSEVAIN